jgi:hypothetical protein
MNEIYRWYFSRNCGVSVLASSCLNTLHGTNLYDILSYWPHFVDVAYPASEALLQRVLLWCTIIRQLLPMNATPIQNLGPNIQHFIWQRPHDTQKQPHPTQKTAWYTNTYRTGFEYRSMDLRDVNRNTALKNKVSISTWWNPAEWTPRSLTL